MKPIYLDYAATTPIDPRVAAKMMQHLTQDGVFANPASKHCFGQEAHAACEFAREQVATFIHADPTEIIWTPGATEAVNLAIKGAAHLYQRRGKHMITWKTEHKAVLDSCLSLEKEGYRVTYLSPLSSGRIDVDAFVASLCEDTILVSVMHVNNETGVYQDIAAIAAITYEKGILLHVDAAQSIGKVPLNLSEIPVDLVSLCAHKVYGPKGIGALFLRKKPRVRVTPLINGGGHEQGMRSGTLAPHQIVGMGEAFAIAKSEFKKDVTHITQLRDQFVKNLAGIANIAYNASFEDAVPHILNLRFEGMIAQAILKELPELACSQAAACQGQGIEGSHVLRAMGYNAEQIKGSLRLSFGRFTTTTEIDRATYLIQKIFTP